MRESFTVIAAETLYSRTSSAKQKIRPDSEKPKHHRKIQNPERGFKEKKKQKNREKERTFLISNASKPLGSPEIAYSEEQQKRRESRKQRKQRASTELQSLQYQT